MSDYMSDYIAELRLELYDAMTSVRQCGWWARAFRTARWKKAVALLRSSVYRVSPLVENGLPTGQLVLLAVTLGRAEEVLASAS